MIVSDDLSAKITNILVRYSIIIFITVTNYATTKIISITWLQSEKPFIENKLVKFWRQVQLRFHTS